MFEVELIEVTKKFGETVGVENLSLNVARGEFLFVLGPSGCGKTTTLRMIAGLEQPSKGIIKINGQTVNGMPTYKRSTAMVFQNWCLFPHKTVYDNVAFGLRMRRFPKANIKTRVRQTLELLELAEHENRMPHQLSGGEQQRVALGRALIVEPSVLLLDEPFSNLDHRLRQQMRLELSQIQKQLGVTTVFVTHDPQEALSMADRVVIMRAGNVEQIGTPAEVYEQPETEFVAGFTGEMNFFFGEIKNQNDHETVIVTKDNLTLKILTVDQSVTGRRVSVSVRPAEIEFFNGKLASTPNIFTGTIYHKAYMGSLMRYYIRLREGVVIFADRDLDKGGIPYDVGDEIQVGWEPDRCLYFPSKH